MQPRDCKRRGRRWVAHCYTQTQRINRNGNEPSIYYVMQMIFRWHKCSVIQKEVCVVYIARLARFNSVCTANATDIKW